MTVLPPDAISWRRKWWAIGASTVLVMVSTYGLVFAAVAAASDDPNPPSPTAPAALGLAIIPFVFLTAAFLSKHRYAPGAVLAAMGLSVPVALIISAIARDVVSGLVAGFGAGAIVSLRSERVHSWQGRATAVILATVYIFVVLRVVSGIGIAMAPLMPFMAVGMADLIMEYRAENNSRSTGQVDD